MFDTILLVVLVVFVVADRWTNKVKAASQREELQMTFREGGRCYVDGYKLAYREFKQRDAEDE